MSADGKTQISVGLDAKEAVDHLGKFKEGFESFFTLLQGAAAGAAFAEFIRAAQKSDAAVVQLQQTLKNSGYDQGLAGGFRRQAEQLERLTGIEEEQVMEVQRLLISYGATADQMRELTPAVIDLAAAMGQDVVTSARQVGRALDEKELNIGKLNIRVGSINELMRVLKERFAGNAEEAFKALGPFGKLRVEIEELEKAVGHIAAGQLGPWAGQLSELVKLLSAHPMALNALMTLALTGTAGAGVIGLGMAIKAVPAMGMLGAAAGGAAAVTVGYDWWAGVSRAQEAAEASAEEADRMDENLRRKRENKTKEQQSIIQKEGRERQARMLDYQTTDAETKLQLDLMGSGQKLEYFKAMLDSVENQLADPVNMADPLRRSKLRNERIGWIGQIVDASSQLDLSSALQLRAPDALANSGVYMSGVEGFMARSSLEITKTISEDLKAIRELLGGGLHIKELAGL